MKTFACAALIVALLAGDAHARDLTRWVDPFIGTGGHGHTYPGPALPFGMIQPGPDTRLTGWDGCSGYHYSDSTIYGFSHTHLSGTGVADYCDILLLPATGSARLFNNYENAANDGYGSRFRKSTEKAEAGYYAVELEDYGVKVELTATLRTGWHRYTFERADSAHVLIDLTHRDEVIESYVWARDARRIDGLRRSKSWAKDQRVYFAIEFDHDFSPELSGELYGDDSDKALTASGRNVKAVLRFNVRPGERVLAKVALSSVSEEGAWKNLRAEAPGWNFDATRKAARSAWHEQLSKIEVEGGSDEEKTIFYTALYHASLQPNIFEDVDGRFRGMDGKVHDSPGYTRYTVFSLWDTFRAAHPLYTIIERERTLDFIQTFLAMYQESGRLPVWELWGNETDCMIGYHAVSVIVDAWAKGIRGFDEKLALEAMIAAADADRFGLDSYRKYGYIPADKESESVSKTLEYAYDDWCIARFAPPGEVHDRFLRRAQAWRHLIDANGFLRPRADGRWLAPFDPTEVTFHYTEANAWQYRFFVPHDVNMFAWHLPERGGLWEALNNLFEGESTLRGRDQADITGLVGQYAHGNEPSHHIAYLYAFAASPKKTQELVSRIMTEMYRAEPDGLIGNEDCGQMSAWYVFSALGFYPVLPGGDYYVFGVPRFTRADIHLESGKKLVVRRKGDGVLLARGSAVSLGDAWLRHDKIMSGGEIVFSPASDADMSRKALVWPTAFCCADDVVAAPVVDAPSVFTDSVLVALTPPFVERGSEKRERQIRYTLDGSEPNADSPIYRAPFSIRDPGILRVRAVEARGPRGTFWSPTVDATFRKVDPRMKITMRNGVHRQYQAGGDFALIDGIRGGTDFRLGTWQGYYGVDLDADIDLGGRAIRRIATGFLHDQNSWIFFPLEVVYSVSSDGQVWRELGRVTSSLDPRHDAAVIEDFVVELKAPVTARYVRVYARAPIMCPDWHKGAGNQSFIFADEVVIQ